MSVGEARAHSQTEISMEGYFSFFLFSFFFALLCMNNSGVDRIVKSRRVGIRGRGGGRRRGRGGYIKKH